MDYFKLARFVDPRGRPTVTVGSDHYIHTFRTCIPTFQNRPKQKKQIELWDGRVDHLLTTPVLLFLPLML